MGKKELGLKRFYLYLCQMLVCCFLALSFDEIIYDVRCYVAFWLPSIFKVADPSDQVLLLTIRFELGMKDSLNCMLLLHLV